MDKNIIRQSTLPEDMAKSRHWTHRLFSCPEDLPVSFVYNGIKITGIPGDWYPSKKRKRIDTNIIETIYEGNDAVSGLNLRVECIEYMDYPVAEWTAWLTNRNFGPTMRITEFLGLDASFDGCMPVLWHCNGDFGSAEGYTPTETPLETDKKAEFAPRGGRPCDGAFPYFRIRFIDCGLTLAVGWPAQWSASFLNDGGSVHVTACQQTTDFRLMPGESVRTPRITLLSWTGDGTRAVNLWRRWYLDHILPRPDGRPLDIKLACMATDPGMEFTNANEKNQITYISKFKQKGINCDVWWIDAGWYPCYNSENVRQWWLTGSWEPDPERFPDGLMPVSDHAGKNGSSLLLWFEPERVVKRSRLEREHPEWLLKQATVFDGAGSRLLDLGNDECRQWLTEHVCKLIKDNGVKIYRQDFNFEPLCYWEENDKDDRRGILENKHVQGYLKFWDDLLERNPGLWIDSCSSGGRRNDLETMRRSVPLHYSDYGYGDHPIKTAFHHTLYSWIPYFKEATLSWDVTGPEEDRRYDKFTDAYSFHCGMAPMMFVSLDIHRDDYDYDTAVKMIGIWRRAAGMLLHGDYYPITPFSKSPDKWVVWQFDCPEAGTGLIQGIRLASCPDEEISVVMKGLIPDRKYLFEDPETGAKMEKTGGELAAGGFIFKLPKRSAQVWFYSIAGE